MRIFRPAACLLASLTCQLALAAGEDSSFPYLDVSGEVNNTVASAYFTRGRCTTLRPNLQSEASVYFDTRRFGYAFIGIWTFSDLSDRYVSDRYMMMNETDPYAGAGYDWKFLDGWSLRSNLFYEWNLIYGSHKGVRYCHELFWSEQLRTPWLTCYTLVRNMRMPYMDWSLRVGFKRGFALSDSFILTPELFFDGGRQCWNRRRFGGYDPRADDFHTGPNSMTGRLRVNYALNENFDFYAGVSEYCALGNAVRDNLRAKPAETAVLDLFFVDVGLKCRF